MNTKIIKPLIFGAAFFLFPYLLIAQTTKQTYCSIFDQIQNYDGQIIRTRALMTYSTGARVDGADSFIYSQDCNNRDYFAVVEFSESELLRKWDKFFAMLPNEKNLILEIDFVGKLKTSIIPLYGHLSWNRTEIEITEIKFIKDVTSASNIKRPDTESDAPLTKRGKQLSNLPIAITRDLLNKDYNLLNGYISEDFKITGESGKTATGKDFRQLSSEDLFGNSGKFESLIMCIKNVSQKNQYFNAVVELEFTFTDEKVQKLKVENVFRLVKEDFLLTEIKISKF